MKPGFFDGYAVDNFFDEAFHDDGTPRAHYRHLVERLGEFAAGAIQFDADHQALGADLGHAGNPGQGAVEAGLHACAQLRGART